MSKKTEWLCSIGCVVVALVLASVQKKRELEEEAKMTPVYITNIFIEKTLPETKI